MINPIFSLLNQIYYLYKTHASFDIIKKLFVDKLNKKKLLKTYEIQHLEFSKEIVNLNLDSDWYAGNYYYWLSLFDHFNLYKRDTLKVLEIGSWEGLSSFFILHNLKNATLTCVDTWGGSDEQNASTMETDEVLLKTETNFDYNLKMYCNRLTKIKSTSFEYFNIYNYKNYYDLIYVDGSHHCDDVIIDGVKCFEQLKIGGLMIFDDYFWRFYPNFLDNPASAINCILNTKKNSFKVINVYEQIIIQKLSDRYS